MDSATKEALTLLRDIGRVPLTEFGVDRFDAVCQVLNNLGVMHFVFNEHATDGEELVTEEKSAILSTGDLRSRG